MSVVQCFEEMFPILGKICPHRTTIFRWYKQLQIGKFDREDDSHTSWPPTAVTSENLAAVEKLLNESGDSPAEIEELLHIDASAVENILHKHLRVKKVCTVWVPHSITEEQRQERIDKMVQNNAETFWIRDSKECTLEPPYKRPPYSGSVDGVLGYGAWGERRRRSSRVRKSGSSVTTERAVSPVSCSGPRWWPCELQRTLALALYMSASKRAYFRTRFHSSKRQRVMRLPAAVRRTVESSSYGPDCLHSETLKDSLHLA